MKRKVTILVIAAFLILAPGFMESAIAQPPPPDVDPEVPIDGGLTVLLVAGMVYGARKLRAERDV